MNELDVFMDAFEKELIRRGQYSTSSIIRVARKAVEANRKISPQVKPQPAVAVLAVSQS